MWPIPPIFEWFPLPDFPGLLTIFGPSAFILSTLPPPPSLRNLGVFFRSHNPKPPSCTYLTKTYTSEPPPPPWFFTLNYPSSSVFLLYLSSGYPTAFFFCVTWPSPSLPTFVFHLCSFASITPSPSRLNLVRLHPRIFSLPNLRQLSPFRFIGNIPGPQVFPETPPPRKGAGV